MLDPKKLLDELLGSNVPGTQSSVRNTAGKAAQMAKDNPLAAGALAAVLLGTGTGRKITGSAVKLGGLAAIAGLAYKAYQGYQSGRQPEQATQQQPELLPPPRDTTFHPSQAPQGETEFALTLVRAMIAAAKSDGHIDDAERRKIGDKLSLSGMGAEEESFLLAELEKPVDLDAIVNSAKAMRRRSSCIRLRAWRSTPTAEPSGAISTSLRGASIFPINWSTMSRRRSRRQVHRPRRKPRPHPCGDRALPGSLRLEAFLCA